MSSGSPCAACKLQRRKCTPGCVFAPYFPADQPSKFACVHRVFGASNVAKLLGDLRPAQRERAADSLVYEAHARLDDPVYGCVRYITFLQGALRQVQIELDDAKRQVAAASFPHLFLQTPAPAPSFGLAAASAEAPPPLQPDAMSFDGGLFKQMGDGAMMAAALESFRPSINLNRYP